MVNVIAEFYVAWCRIGTAEAYCRIFGSRQEAESVRWTDSLDAKPRLYKPWVQEFRVTLREGNPMIIGEGTFFIIPVTRGGKESYTVTPNIPLRRDSINTEFNLARKALLKLYTKYSE